MTSGDSSAIQMQESHPDQDIETDRRFVSLDQACELAAWLRSFDCTEAELRGAMVAVGNSASAVLNFLTTGRAARPE